MSKPIHALCVELARITGVSISPAELEAALAKCGLMLHQNGAARAVAGHLELLNRVTGAASN